MNIISATSNDSEEIAKIVAMSNKDVAERFSINRQNNPKHPSFYDQAWVLSDFERGEEYFLYREGNNSVACVAYEQLNSHVGYLNRLSVLPAHRKKGIGEKLVNHTLNYASTKGVEEISIGIIAKHEKLKKWYLQLGFVENGVKEFPHLPFDVMFMKFNLAKNMESGSNGK
jgi:N-acetylglutamate synthase-like GNAT family acetyltransferase